MLLRPVEVAGAFPCVMQETAEPLGALLLPRDPDGSSWGGWPLPIIAVRCWLVQGIADIVQHSTHMCSLEGTCMPVNSHMYVHSTLVYM